LSAANFWNTSGNAGANPTNGAFIGTTDNLALEFKVNGTRVLRLEPNALAPNVVGGISSQLAGLESEERRSVAAARRPSAGFLEATRFLQVMERSEAGWK